MCMLFILTGCTKEENSENKLLQNQYYLLAGDGEKLLVTLPEEFLCKEQNKEAGVIKAYYQGNATKLLSLYYFKETKEYSSEHIERKLEHFSKEYEDLVSLNNGKIVCQTTKQELNAGNMKGYFSDVLYELDNNESYCAEFYLKSNGYVLNGTLRLEGKDAKDIQINKLAIDLVN